MSYGNCPTCGAKGVMRERRLYGNDKCVNGHTYPSKDSIHESEEDKMGVKGAVKMIPIHNDCRNELLIKSGWSDYYHYITEDPEDGDLDHEHYFLHAEDMGAKFPHLKCKMEVME